MNINTSTSASATNIITNIITSMSVDAMSTITDIMSMSVGATNTTTITTVKKKATGV